MERGEVTIVFKDVPADVCDTCGEAFIEEDVSEDVYEQTKAAVCAFLAVVLSRDLPDGMSEQAENPYAASAWEDFRGEGFADVKAAAEYYDDQAQVYGSWADEFDDQLTSRQCSLKVSFYERRRAGLDLLLAHMAHYGPGDIPAWSSLPEEKRKQPSGNSELDTLSKYQDEIQEVLESNPPGTFNNKTALYRRVDERMGLSGDACRRYLNQEMDDEPSDEEEWREYLLETK